MELYVSGARPAALPEYREDAPTPTHWWETPHGSWRMSREEEAMRERFPRFCPLHSFRDGLESMGWLGWLRSSLPPRRRYCVEVLYPPAFPDDPPEVSILHPRLPADTPHLLLGKRPCLFDPRAGPRHGYDPGATTAATLVAWTSLWINAFETWRATGHWPGKAD